MNLKKQLNCRMVYLFPLYLDILGTISLVQCIKTCRTILSIENLVTARASCLRRSHLLILHELYWCCNESFAKKIEKTLDAINEKRNKEQEKK